MARGTHAGVGSCVQAMHICAKNKQKKKHIRKCILQSSPMYPSPPSSASLYDSFSFARALGLPLALSLSLCVCMCVYVCVCGCVRVGTYYTYVRYVFIHIHSGHDCVSMRGEQAHRYVRRMCTAHTASEGRGGGGKSKAQDLEAHGPGGASHALLPHTHDDVDRNLFLPFMCCVSAPSTCHMRMRSARRVRRARAGVQRVRLV